MVTAVRDQAVDVAFLEELVAEAYLENNPELDFDVLGEPPPARCDRVSQGIALCSTV
jgi:polar amino acid transport system substrate-binding protein